MSLIWIGIPVILILLSAVKILPEWDRGVILQFGRFVGVRGPGLIFLIPFVEKLIRVDTRTVTMDIQPQDIISKDNVSLKVNAVIYFRVLEPSQAITKIEDYYFATSQLSQTTLRSVLGQYEMDDLLSNREKLNHTLQEILDHATEPWGIKITTVEIKQIDLPSSMQRAMARQAEAERERRAKVISAEGELERASKLAEAAETMSSSSALFLAYLQTLTEVSGESSQLLVMPLPMDLIEPFMKHRGKTAPVGVGPQKV